MCHSHTENIEDIIKTADIVISAVGKKIVRCKMVKNNSCLVDVGIFKDANGKLTVSMGGNTFVSNNALQKDKWQYLSFSYDAETESLSANYAYDAYDLILFSSQNVGQYTGNGKITLGKGMTGQMHDVALWNYARPWSEAQGEMYEKKTRYSDGLMGYWQLDEGHGTAATDCARSRTLTLPSASACICQAITTHSTSMAAR